MQYQITSWILSRFTTTSGNSRKSDGIVNAQIVKNTNAIPLYTNCHYQKMLLIISTALLFFAVIVKKSQFNEERIEGILRRNILHEYDVHRRIFKIKHNFPNYDWVKNRLFKKLSKRRYQCLRWVHEDWMSIKNINTRSKINDFGHDPDKFIRDFNKIVRTLMNKPEFVFMD